MSMFDSLKSKLGIDSEAESYVDDTEDEIFPGGQGGGLSGQTTDIKIHAEHMVYIRDKMNRMLSEYTGQPLEKILRNMIRVCFLRPRQRPYKTKNFYAVVMRQDQLDREVYHIVNGKAKTDPHREKADRGRHRQGEPDR